MENPIYIALSRENALQRQLDIVANNMANMDTPAYKDQRVQFVEYLAKTGTSSRVSMVQDRAVIRNLDVGAINTTSNPLDLALQDHGYFVVETIDGPRYTRNGHFQIDSQGRLVDSNGLPVLDDSNRSIVIPEGSQHVTVHGDGSIETENGPVARLNVVRFDREAFMNELGRGLYATDEKPQAAPDVKVVQGALEASNVKPVVEMTTMTDLLRQYEMTMKLIEAENQRQETAIQRLTHVS